MVNSRKRMLKCAERSTHSERGFAFFSFFLCVICDLYPWDNLFSGRKFGGLPLILRSSYVFRASPTCNNKTALVSSQRKILRFHMELAKHLHHFPDTNVYNFGTNTEL